MFRSTRVALLTASFVGLLISSALAIEIPGTTQGDWQLQQDTWRLMEMFDRARAPKCNSRKVIDTKVVKEWSNGKWSELWIISRCGKKVQYPVDYITHPSGSGVMIGVRPPR